MPGAECLTVYDQRASCGVVPLPDATGAIGQIAVVAARREEETPVSDRPIDSSGYDAVLKHGFLAVSDVVDDDVGTGLAERLDVLRHPGLASIACREIQLCSGREVVDDLEQRRPLAPLSLLSRQHRYPGGYVTRCLPVGERPDTVRDHADPDSSTVDVVSAARRVRPMGDVALRGVFLAGHRGVRNSRPGDGWERGCLPARSSLVGWTDRPDRVQLGQRLDGGGRQVRPDGPVARHAVDHHAAQIPDARQDLRRHIRPDVDRHQSRGSIRVPSLPARSSGRAFRRLPPGVQELGAHLSL